MKPEISASSRRIFIVFEFSKPFSKMAAERFSLGGKCSEQSLSSIMLAIQKLKRIANRTIFDRDMIDKRFRNGKIISVMKAVFQDGGRTVQFRRKMFRAKFKQHHVGYSETQTNCKSDYI